MIKYSFIGFVVFLGAPLAAFAGPDVIEGSVDAGRFISTAMDTTVLIVGQPTSIAGRLGGTENPLVGNDYVDSYLITITDPVFFTAQTFPTLIARQMGTPSDFDTQLWLFDASGLGLLANDDKALANIGSLITAPSTDGTAITIPGPGTYLLAISVKGVFPLSGIGSIFDLTGSPTEISGPDGLGGTGALSSWDETLPSVVVPGNYFIEIVPAPGASMIAGVFGVMLGRRRRR